MSHPAKLNCTSFSPADTARGEDGELYHLPTLRRLHALGRLTPGTPAHLLLLEALAGAAPVRARLIA
ncbi:hypothetical protein [Deinococcus sp. Leaf326]|jgi:hypothetical protein|uniref:hypothetical protein n=1 Tax=Deinococcus sp. Leaf326 TaxID=1736338 RepID=UPI0006FD3A58|nr:hypothetical protein [Deinococcus sp. Leaf326]KQR04731.1 hypothetical protein ASF71_12010 [Deinococcus sp. Leaf326]